MRQYSPSRPPGLPPPLRLPDLSLRSGRSLGLLLDLSTLVASLPAPAAVLTGAEQRRYAAIVEPAERARRQSTRTALRLVLAGLTGVAPRELHLVADAAGKPRLADAGASVGWLANWVRKEAVLKAVGVGFSTDPRGLDVGWHEAQIASQRTGEGLLVPALYLHEAEPAPGCRAAVATPQASCDWFTLVA